MSYTKARTQHNAISLYIPQSCRKKKFINHAATISINYKTLQPEFETWIAQARASQTLKELKGTPLPMMTKGAGGGEYVPFETSGIIISLFTHRTNSEHLNPHISTVETPQT